tara:strand:- start:2095 stop:2586 length:492 start_codon:yes stop_codon:yes gene_type:complete
MSKESLENKILSWSRKFIKSLKDYELIEIIRSENLSKINSENIKKFQNYGNWDFTPDFALIIKNIKEDKLNIILINRDNKSVGLRSIGEIMCFNKIVNPIYSFLISEKGHSDEISYFMINENLRSKLMNYFDNTLIIFSFDDNSEKIKKESIIPFSKRKTLND